MASIRRTLSPAFRDRPYLNGGTPFSVQSPSHKLFSSSKYSSPLVSAFLTFAITVRRFVAGVLLQRAPRKGQQWRRAFYRCLLFFFVGFLLGLLPFGHVVNDAEIRGQGFNFDIKPPHVNVQFDNDGGDQIVKRREDLVFNANPAVVEKGDEVPRKQLIVVTTDVQPRTASLFLEQVGATAEACTSAISLDCGGD
ncbi:hypothetical protein M0R45_027127 [Rubus argutus]|uniref:Transmembrane protein n=1 Tax=Rubus argutus TaxID=59490 RepID=A0AAW1X176_RUBAR